MAFPPPTMATGFANADPQLDTHPNVHSAVGAAINDIVAEVKTRGKLLGTGVGPVTNTTLTTTPATATGWTVTWNADPARSYRIYVEASLSNPVANAIVTIGIATVALATQRQMSSSVPTGGIVSVSATEIVTGLSGSQTRVGIAYATTAGVILEGAFQRNAYIEVIEF